MKEDIALKHLDYFDKAFAESQGYISEMDRFTKEMIMGVASEKYFSKFKAIVSLYLEDPDGVFPIKSAKHFITIGYPNCGCKLSPAGVYHPELQAIADRNDYERRAEIAIAADNERVKNEPGYHGQDLDPEFW